MNRYTLFSPTQQIRLKLSQTQKTVKTNSLGH